MELIAELLKLIEAGDPQLQRLRDQMHQLRDQAEDIRDAGGELPPSLEQRIKQLQNQIDAKKRQLGIGKP